MAPEHCGDELQERNDVEGSKRSACWFAVEEEIEQFETDRVALIVESFWLRFISDTFIDPSLESP